MTDNGICNHSFHARRALNALYEVCKGTPNGFEFDHSCTVTNRSERGFCAEPTCRNSGFFSRTENGACFCFPSSELLHVKLNGGQSLKTVSSNQGLIGRPTYTLTWIGKSTCVDTAKVNASIFRTSPFHCCSRRHHLAEETTVMKVSRRQ